MLTTAPSSHFVRICLFLFLASLFIQCVGVSLRGQWWLAPEAFPNEMLVQAHLVADGRGFVSPEDSHSASTLLPPAYVLLIAAVVKFCGLFGYTMLPALAYAGIIFMQAVLSSLLAPMGYAIALALSWPRRAALLGGMALCLCPESVRAAGFLWDEALFTTACAAILWWMVTLLKKPVAHWKDSFWLGLASGILTLLNPAFLPATFAAWILGNLWRLRLGKLFLHAVIFSLMALAGGSPWHIRNWLLLDPPAPVFIRGGFFMEVWGNTHPITFEERDGRRIGVPFGVHWKTEAMERDGVLLTEQQYFAYCRERALAWIKQHPAEYAGHVARQVVNFWTGLDEAARWEKPWYKFFIPQALPAIVGLIGLWLARRGTPANIRATGIGMLLVFPLVYYLSSASMRFRHPIDILLFLGVGYFIHAVWPTGKFSEPTRSPSPTPSLLP